MPSNSPLIKKAKNTIEFKQELLAKYESGVRVADLARMYGKSASTISSIMFKKKNQESWCCERGKCANETEVTSYQKC